MREPLTRRHVIQGIVAAALAPALTRRMHAAQQTDPGPIDRGMLPPGIRSRVVHNVNGIRMHVLESGFEADTRPLVVLVHGFPELAYSWRKVMPRLAAAGYHVIAPDMRGYGRTDLWDVKYDDDLSPWRSLNRVMDILGLVSAFGYHSVACVVGHDVGSGVAAWCAITRPDIFRSVVMMSAPFGGTPTVPFNTAAAGSPPSPPPPDTIYDELAKLSPPRKHYQRYYTTREANANMWKASQGVHDFLRAYYHMKSADWKPNAPHPLSARTAAEWAKMPRYYIMDLDKGMAETVASEMPSASQIAACKWLPDDELRVYSSEYGRTGFQGGLQTYRLGTGRFNDELRMFAGRTIDQPSMFISGKSDWGVYQNPGAYERMQKTACRNMVASHLLEGAGHWVQQEQAGEVTRLLIQFLRDSSLNSAA
jgi:pimeloyl-ACP methyl ester carboxylesterase